MWKSLFLSYIFKYKKIRVWSKVIDSCVNQMMMMNITRSNVCMHVHIYFFNLTISPQKKNFNYQLEANFDHEYFRESREMRWWWWWYFYAVNNIARDDSVVVEVSRHKLIINGFHIISRIFHYSHRRPKKKRRKNVELVGQFDSFGTLFSFSQLSESLGGFIRFIWNGFPHPKRLEKTTFDVFRLEKDERWDWSMIFFKLFLILFLLRFFFLLSIWISLFKKTQPQRPKIIDCCRVSRVFSHSSFIQFYFHSFNSLKDMLRYLWFVVFHRVKSDRMEKRWEWEKERFFFIIILVNWDLS